MKRFVLDASVALAWFVDDPIPGFADRVREKLVQGGKAVVPTLWHMELANGLIMAERRRKLSHAECMKAIEKIGQLLETVIETSSNLVPIRRNFEIAQAFQLSAYDAVYLIAAQSENLPLATLDRQLAKAAAVAGVEILS